MNHTLPLPIMFPSDRPHNKCYGNKDNHYTNFCEDAFHLVLLPGGLLNYILSGLNDDLSFFVQDSLTPD